MQDIKKIKEQFKKDTEQHSMEILMDDGLYRHLKFTNNGSQCYRFDIHTWPGFLCICQDMGTYVFSRVPDMFDFFIMNDNNFNKKHVINPGYWAEKLQAVNKDGTICDGNGYEEFSSDLFAEYVKTEYDNFCEDHLDDDAENVSEAYPENVQSKKQQLEELWDTLSENVIPAAYDGSIRAYDAATEFRWESEDGDLVFDMQDFWDHSCTEYTYHYIWVLYAIVWGIGTYNEVKEMAEIDIDADVELHQA